MKKCRHTYCGVAAAAVAAAVAVVCCPQEGQESEKKGSSSSAAPDAASATDQAAADAAAAAAAAGSEPSSAGDAVGATAPAAATRAAKTASAAAAAATAAAAAAAGVVTGAKKVCYSWGSTGLRFVALARLKLKGGPQRMQRNEGVGGGPSGPRVKIFPGVTSPRAERLAAFVLLLFTALCAFVAVTGDLLAAAALLLGLLQQAWALACVSFTHVASWLAGVDS